MVDSSHELRRRYESRDTDELVRILEEGGLRADAKMALLQVLSQRGESVEHSDEWSLRDDQVLRAPGGLFRWLHAPILSKHIGKRGWQRLAVISAFFVYMSSPVEEHTLENALVAVLSLLLLLGIIEVVAYALRRQRTYAKRKLERGGSLPHVLNRPPSPEQHRR